MNDSVACLNLALWALNVAAPIDNIAAWAAAVEARLAEARGQGADLLVLPEHVSGQWLQFAPRTLAPSEEIPWFAEQAEHAIAAIRALAQQYGVGLLAGSMPVRQEGGEPQYVNRAYLFLPDGREIIHDKLCLTPDERDPEAWAMQPGTFVTICDWRGLRLAMLICLDVELPALAARIAEHDIDLLLVPSMTHRLSGYNRVFGCAKARAVELLTAVAAVGCVGRMGNLPCVGGASVFLPCEEALGSTGIAAETGPLEQADGPGPLLIARDLPLATLRALRLGGAEVWPGAWHAGEVEFRRA